jgi:hypothetical protein
MIQALDLAPKDKLWIEGTASECYAWPLLPACLVPIVPEAGDSMFLLNVSVDIYLTTWYYIPHDTNYC